MENFEHLSVELNLKSGSFRVCTLCFHLNDGIVLDGEVYVHFLPESCVSKTALGTPMPRQAGRLFEEGQLSYWPL
jgi:hypothetical protein